MERFNKKILGVGGIVLTTLLVGCGTPTVESVVELIEKGDFKKANTQLTKLDESAGSEVGQQIGATLTDKVKEFASVHQTEESKKQLVDKLSEYKQINYFEPLVADVTGMVEEIYNIDSMYQLGEKAQNDQEYVEALDCYSTFINLYEESDLTCLNEEFLKSAQLKIEEIVPELKGSTDYTLPVQVIGTLISKNSIGNQELGVQFKNISDKAIKKVEFSVLAFKEDGTPEKLNFGSSSIGNCTYDTALGPNEISDSGSSWNMYSENDQVAHVIIITNSVEFYEGEKWENPLYTYEVSKYENVTLSKEEIGKIKTDQAQAMAEAAAQAEPAPLEIVSTSLRKNIIDKQTVNVQFKNVSDKAIKELTFSVLAYDKNGYPVKVGFGNDEYLNFKFDNTVQPNETTSPDWTWDLHANTEVSKVKVILGTVEFYEGDTWNNISYNTELNNSIGKVYSE